MRCCTRINPPSVVRYIYKFILKANTCYWNTFLLAMTEKFPTIFLEMTFLLAIETLQHILLILLPFLRILTLLCIFTFKSKVIWTKFIFLKILEFVFLRVYVCPLLVWCVSLYALYRCVSPLYEVFVLCFQLDIDFGLIFC